MSQVIKILSIDGGGIRGIIPAMVLAEIEKRTGNPISSSFDLIAGTSTGGLLALGVTKPNKEGQPAYTAEQSVMLYEERGVEIFSRSLWHRVQSVNRIVGSKYSGHRLEAVLRSCFGNTLLSEALTNVFITSYEIERRTPWFFRSHKARNAQQCNFLMRDVLRATVAAPTYFDPAKINLDENNFFALIDGGVVANNPAMCAYIEAKTIFPEAEEFLILSLGTGEVNRKLSYEEAQNWGLAGWSQNLFSVFFHAMDKTVDYQMKRLLPACKDGHQHYYRLQKSLTGANDDMDDVSPENIHNLKAIAQDLILENDQLLDELVGQLTCA